MQGRDLGFILNHLPMSLITIPNDLILGISQVKSSSSPYRNYTMQAWWSLTRTPCGSLVMPDWSCLLNILCYFREVLAYFSTPFSPVLVRITFVCK